MSNIKFMDTVESNESQETVTLTKAELAAMLEKAANGKVKKEKKPRMSEEERKAQTKARTEAALKRSMVNGITAAQVREVWNEAYRAAKGKSGEEYKSIYNNICIEKIGVPRYVSNI